MQILYAGSIYVSGATFAKAQADILKYLADQGWNVKLGLKIPYATSPDGELRLWFKPQAVYYTAKKHVFKEAHSISYELDTRKLTPEQFLEYIQKLRGQGRFKPYDSY